MEISGVAAGAQPLADPNNRAVDERPQRNQGNVANDATQAPQQAEARARPEDQTVRASETRTSESGGNQQQVSSQQPQPDIEALARQADQARSERQQAQASSTSEQQSQLQEQINEVGRPDNPAAFEADA